jgi:hypothetical protein
MPHIDLTTTSQSMASLDNNRQFAMTPGDATTIVYVMSTDNAGATTGGVIVAVLNAANPMVRVSDTAAYLYYAVPPLTTAPMAVWVDANPALGVSSVPYWTVSGPSVGAPWGASHPLVAGELAPFDTSIDSLVATLPSAVGIAGQRCAIKDATGGAHSIGVATTSGQTVDGSSSPPSISAYGCHVYVSDGANWLLES